jgi:NADH:ubiquinone oxidoreductase subunit C
MPGAPIRFPGKGSLRGLQEKSSMTREELQTLLPEGTSLELKSDGWWLDAPATRIAQFTSTLLAQGAALSTITGKQAEAGETLLIYHFIQPGVAVNLRTSTDHNQIQSVTPLTRSADWIEREVHDLFGAAFVGHPNLARLIRPPQLAAGMFRTPDSGAH